MGLSRNGKLSEDHEGPHQILRSSWGNPPFPLAVTHVKSIGQLHYIVPEVGWDYIYLKKENKFA